MCQMTYSLAKLLSFLVFCTFFDVQVVVSSKERKVSDASVQNVEGSQPSEFHEGRSHVPSEKLPSRPDEGRDPAVDALL